MTARKPPDKRQRTGTGTADVSENVAGGPADRGAPPAPSRIRRFPAIEQAWRAFWELKPLARKVSDADVPALARLFEMYAAYELAMNAFIEEPFVEGERGKTVAHPGWSIANAAMRQILPLEKQFGITPKARSELGISLDVPSPGDDPGNAAMDFTDA
jgi:P27 family predicted phage terminase small subunit